MYFPDSGAIALNTFAWIDGRSDLNHPQLGHDIRSQQAEFIFSKRYDRQKTSVFEVAPPLLLVQENGGTFSNIFKDSNRPQTIDHRITILVLDNYVDSRDRTAGPEDRELAQVYDDCREILRKVLTYFDKIAYCTITNLDASTTSGYYHTGLLDYMVANSLITGYTQPESGLTDWVRGMLGGGNLAAELNIVPPSSGEQYAGVACDITFQEPVCEAVSWSFGYTGSTLVYGKD